jgi:vacuolar protein-sorting-associated protein 4
MDNSNFCNQAIDLVQKAIEADDKGEHEQALGLYRDALSRFAMAIKYEQNPKRKELLTQRAGDYMERAEQLKKNLSEKSGNGSNTSGSPSKKESGQNGGGNVDKSEADDDPETKKLRGALASAIVSEKPNVKVRRWKVAIPMQHPAGLSHKNWFYFPVGRRNRSRGGQGVTQRSKYASIDFAK